jgi:Ca-activated chloride channel family protein
MSDNPIELSRRKILAGLGTIGAASAGVGLGTSAYFSDEETFKNNSLVAGSLDLKVDWEEHYSDWSDDEMVTYTMEDENGDTLPGVKMELDDSDDATMWNAMPDPQNPFLYVHDKALEDFMAATALEAFPDDGDNGSQSLHRYSPDNYCDILADTPEDLDPNQADPARTLNDDTVDENGNPKPLIALEDVKPGDFGELTLSFHLCDNPGYVWMNGQLVSASENGHTEPERKDPDEEDGVVELLDTVQTMLWYDEDGDNVYEPGGTAGEIDVMLVIDRSGSMGGTPLSEAQSAAIDLINALGGGAEVGVTSFADGASVNQGMTANKSAAVSAVQGLSSGGGTNHEAGIQEAQDELANNSRSDVEDIMVILTDGNTTEGGDPVDDATDAKNAGTEIYSVGFGTVDTATINALSSDPDSQYAYTGSVDEIEEIFAQISQILAGEECFFQGSLRELLTELSSGNGIPLDGNRQTAFNEVPSYGDEEAPSDPTADARDCFVPATNNFIGLSWWLPIDHGNEVQTDSAAFDLGFYTEQCRHNDGAGMDLLVPTRRGSGFAKIQEDFNGSEQDASSFARARFGDNKGTTGSWEAAVGNSPGDATTGNYQWTPGETVDWTYTYSANDDRARFLLGGDVDIEYTGLADQPDGRVAIQTKANDATIAVEDVDMVVEGAEKELSGPDSVTATNDGDGRDIQYLVINSDLDGDSNFTVSGTVTVSLQDDFGGGEEGVAMDVVLE